MQNGSGEGQGASPPSVQAVDRTAKAQGVNTYPGAVAVGMTLTAAEAGALDVLLDEARLMRDAAITDAYRDVMRDAVVVLERVLDAVAKASAAECERCYIERARLVKQLHEQLLDEAPTNRDPNPLAMTRDAGYRAGWNDRARSLAKELQS